MNQSLFFIQENHDGTIPLDDRVNEPFSEILQTGDNQWEEEEEGDRIEKSGIAFLNAH